METGWSTFEVDRGPNLLNDFPKLKHMAYSTRSVHRNLLPPISLILVSSCGTVADMLPDRNVNHFWSSFRTSQFFGEDVKPFWSVP